LIYSCFLVPARFSKFGRYVVEIPESSKKNLTGKPTNKL
jgi:hypothetical protein